MDDRDTRRTHPRFSRVAFGRLPVDSIAVKAYGLSHGFNLNELWL
jgi:hypothetical protein